MVLHKRKGPNLNGLVLFNTCNKLANLAVREDIRSKTKQSITEGDTLHRAIELLRSGVCHYRHSNPRVIQMDNKVDARANFALTNGMTYGATNSQLNIRKRGANAATNAYQSRTGDNKRGMVTVTRVMRCVIAVVIGVPAYVALPLDVRDLIRMVIDVVAWAHTVLPL